MRSLVIIPTYNEVENIPALLDQLRQFPVDVLFIDDHSTDGTAEILRQKALEQEGRLFLLERPRKMGLGTAYIAGFKWALEHCYERVLEMDADFSHNPEDIPRLIAATEEYDLAIGSRYVGGIRVNDWSLGRLLLSLSAVKYVRALTGLPLSDPTGGFKCFRIEALHALDLDRIYSRGFSFQIEINYRIWRMGFLIGEIPVIFNERASGLSKMSLGIALEALWVICRLVLQDGFRRTTKTQRAQRL
jgi:dolichol-phosphate mannosyltransferase